MNSLAFIFIPDIVAIIPGVIALLLFLLFTYLYEQGRQPYFRAWQIGWGAYCLHYALDAWTFYHQPSAAVFLLGSLLLVVMAMCILVSTRLMREGFRLHWYDVAVAVAGSALALWNLATHITRGSFNPDLLPPSHLRLEVGLSLILGYASFQFYRYAHQKGSLAFRIISMALAFWAALMFVGQFGNLFIQTFSGHLLGPIPQMLLGIAMVMVLFESERNAVQAVCSYVDLVLGGRESSESASTRRLLAKVESQHDLVNRDGGCGCPEAKSRGVCEVEQRQRREHEEGADGVEHVLSARLGEREEPVAA